MLNIEYDAYVQDTLNLVRTMVIKFDEVGLLDNQVLEQAGYPVDNTNRRTWRYYLNLNGQYHTTDTPMYVISMDTGETILFSKENLAIHLATKRAYEVGSYYYNRLVDQYPGQFDLINCIIDPIELDYAIQARDYKILKYNKDLVLWNEDQLIPAVQASIDAYVYDAFDTEYLHTDNLMLATLIATLYGKLPGDIMNIRWEAVGYRYVHDFHIWSRINSYGDFYGYKGVLDDFQTMWLYRNVKWVLKNSGAQWTFNELMDKLLTHRAIPLSKYTINKNTETQADDLVPEPMYIRENMNLLTTYGTVEKFYDTNDIIIKELDQAKDNVELQKDYFDDAMYKVITGLHSQIPTKVLESEMEDYTNRHQDSLMKTLTYEWFYLAYNNVYNTVIDFEDPKTGKHIKLTTQEAAVLWNYLLALSRGENCIMVQPCYYENVMKLTLPSVDDLMQFGTERYVDKQLANDIRNVSTSFNRIINPESFFTKCVEVYQLKWKHTKIYSQFYDFKQTAQVEQMCDFMYTAGKQYLTEYKFYDDFLKSIELDLTDYTDAEYDNLAWIIFCKATGWDLFDHYSLRDIQSKLIQLMKQLSSYTVQFVTTMHDGTDTIENGHQIGISYDSGTASVMGTDGMLLPAEQHIVTHNQAPLDLDATFVYLNSLDFEAVMELKCMLPLPKIKEDVEADANPTHANIKVNMVLRDTTGYWDNDTKTRVYRGYIGQVKF